MIANLRLEGAQRSANARECRAMTADSRVWNELYLGIRAGQCARLRFADAQDSDVLALLALDLRLEGWVVVGTRIGTNRQFEYFVDEIRHVEVLGAVKLAAKADPELPPAA